MKPKEIIFWWSWYFMFVIEVLDVHMHTELPHIMVNQSHYSNYATRSALSFSWQLWTPVTFSLVLWVFIREGTFFIKQKCSLRQPTSFCGSYVPERRSDTWYKSVAVVDGLVMWPPLEVKVHPLGFRLGWKFHHPSSGDVVLVIVLAVVLLWIARFFSNYCGGTDVMFQ